MTTELSDILDEIEEDASWSETGWSSFYERVKEHPEDYALALIRERVEQRVIGTHDIPRRGAVILFVDNEWYDRQSRKFKSNFPELKSDKDSAVVERVRDVAYEREGKVNVAIERYLLQQK